MLKGLAYGKCILALDTVFIREVLKDGEYGILFKKNITDLVEKINLIDSKNELAEKFRNRSRNRIKE